MRLNEILIEQQLDEKPMGFLSKLGNKAMSTLGSDKATGKLQSGDEANNLKKQFMTFLGQSRQEAEPEVVIKWLASQGYPTKGAEAEMKKATTGQKVGQAVGQAATTVAKGAVAGAKAVATGAANIAKGAVAGAKAATAAPAAQAPEKIPSQTDAAPAANKTTSTTDNPNAPTASDEPLKVSGVKKKKKIVAPAAIAASIDFSNTSSIMEALSSGQLDNIFLRAVGDKYAQQGGISKKGTGSAPADAQQGGAAGFAQGVKQGADAPQDKKTGFLSGFKQGMDKSVRGPGADVPEEIKSQIEKLNPRQKKELGKLLA